MTQLGGCRPEIDDHAAGAAMLGRHASDRFAGTQEGADHVDGEHSCQTFQGHFIDALGIVDNTGIVDQTLKSAELVGFGEKMQHVGFVWTSP